MENYRDGVDEGNDLDSIDFDTLIKNLEVCICLSITLPCLKVWSGLFLNGPEDVFCKADSSFMCYLLKCSIPEI